MDARLFNARLSADSGAYTDLNRLNQLKTGDRNSEGNIRKVAQEFEALFMNEMMKSMRSANEVFAKDNYLNSETSKQYQDMHDQQLSLSLSRDGHGIGMADVLVRQMQQMSGVKSNGGNPFAQIGDRPLAKAESPQPLRDDRQALNARRLALPGKLKDRQVAGIAPGAAGAGEGKPLARDDWRASGKYDRAAAAVEGKKNLKPGQRLFASRDEFIATMLPMAERAAKRIGVDPRYLVAQAALETGWGKSLIVRRDGSSGHNLFGIKAGGSWQGDSAKALTSEYENGRKVREVAAFRAYDSFEQSFHDYVSFLQNNDRYQDALDSATRPEQFMKELQQAGYATDPQYARKVNQIARQMRVYETVAMADGPTRKI
ncbi:Peptidoglycan hydrolase FlgJ [compost metagenome]